jgi:predicted  nucleic acid-binding Zn-ribbon protein
MAFIEDVKKFMSLSKRLVKIIDKMENQFDELESKIDDLESKIDELEEREASDIEHVINESLADCLHNAARSLR